MIRNSIVINFCLIVITPMFVFAAPFNFAEIKFGEGSQSTYLEKVINNRPLAYLQIHALLN